MRTRTWDNNKKREGVRTRDDCKGQGKMRTKPRENNKGCQGRMKKEWVRTREDWEGQGQMRTKPRENNKGRQGHRKREWGRRGRGGVREDE